MFSIFIFSICLYFTTFANLNADYTLSFNNNDLYFLKRVINSSNSEDRSCDQKSKKEAFDAFIHYGHRNGWTKKTQFGKGVGYGSYCVIKLDPKMFNKDPEHDELKISLFRKKGFFDTRLDFSTSPAMKDLVKETLEDNQRNANAEKVK